MSAVFRNTSDLVPFLGSNLLLHTEAARTLYHEYMAPEPILDYHCHLSPKDIAKGRQFNNLFEIWLEGDHHTALDASLTSVCCLW